MMKGVRLNCELPNETNALGPLPSVAAGDRRRSGEERAAGLSWAFIYLKEDA